LNTLEKYPEFLLAFKSLGAAYTVANELFKNIQKYVCVLYGQFSTVDVNLARFNLFSIGQQVGDLLSLVSKLRALAKNLF
jgi:hypothetical protein